MATDRMGCTWVRDRLPLFAGDDWLGPDRRPIERHLIVCPSCRTQLDELRSSLSILRFSSEAPVLSNPEPLWPALSRQIRESRRSEPSLGLSWPRLLTRLAVAAALVMTAGTLGSNRDVRVQVSRVLNRVSGGSGTTVPPRRIAESTPRPPVNVVDDTPFVPEPLPGTFAESSYSRTTSTAPTTGVRGMIPTH